ncbi:MAG: DUF2721 domain-containing protein [Tepidisphaeraceae bacterium]|jgi:hypothetical protein
MPPSDLSKVISSSVVPVVIISACGLLALAFYNRMAAIVSRLRVFQRERLQEQELLQRAGAENDAKSQRRRRLLEVLELQTAHVIRRAKLIRLTLLFLLLTIGTLIGCCLMLGLSALLPTAMYVAIPLFGLGLLFMLASTIAAALELKASLQPVELESRFVTDVLREDPQRIDDDA